MRASSIYIALSTARSVLGAPVPSFLVDGSPSTLTLPRTGFHPPARVSGSRPPHALPETTNWGPDEDDPSFQTVIDNRLITPPADADPSEVLQADRPIATQYLLAISAKDEDKKHDDKIKVETATAEDQALALPVKTERPGTKGADESISVAEMDITTPLVSQGSSMVLCEQTMHLSRGHTNIVIICLAVVFLWLLFPRLASLSPEAIQRKES